MSIISFVLMPFIFLIFYEIKVASSLLYPQILAAKPRSLIFPVTAPTRIQFIGGIGIPVEDLAYESVTSGYVLKAEYFLPSKAEEMRPNYLKPQLIHRRSINDTQHNNNNHKSELYFQSATNNQSSTFGANFKSQQKNGSAYRWVIYRSIEILLDRARQPGRICLLRSICEHAALPLSHESGMLAEILHIILTPSTSHDDMVKPANKDYLQAEMLGHMGVNCEAEFGECTKSPIDQISTIFNLAD